MKSPWKFLAKLTSGRPSAKAQGSSIGNDTNSKPFESEVDPVALGQRPQALLTILYCSTDRLCRCGAAVKNLSRSASFHFWESNAPSKPGIKHLVSSCRPAICNRPYRLGGIRADAQAGIPTCSALVYFRLFTLPIPGD